MTLLVDAHGDPPKRLSDYAPFCGYCMERLEVTDAGATRCPKGCPP